MWIALIALGWIAISIFNYGALYADYRGSFPWKDSRSAAAGSCVIALLGPLGLAASIAGTDFLRYGWKLKG